MEIMSSREPGFGKSIPEDWEDVPASNSKFWRRLHCLVSPGVSKERGESPQSVNENSWIEPSGIRLPGKKTIFHSDIWVRNRLPRRVGNHPAESIKRVLAERYPAL